MNELPPQLLLAASGPAEESADATPLAEAEQANAVYRYSLRWGLPTVVSLVVHLLLLLVLALTTLVVGTEAGRADRDRAYHASLTDNLAGADVNEFQWSTRQHFSAEKREGDPAIAPLNIETPSKLDFAFGGGAPQPAPGLAGGLGQGNEFGGGMSRGGLIGRGVGASVRGSSGAEFGAGSGGSAGGSVGAAGMWGRTVRANRIVFVIDYSGSIIVAVDDLTRELKRSIGSLQPDQSFNVVIFYSEDDRFKTESFSSMLQPATPDTRQRFFEWIDRRSPAGRTDPLPALKRALALEPDAIFFLSDGDFEQDIIDKVRASNRHGVKICCLLFDEATLQNVSGSPLLDHNARRLKNIAEDSGGWMVVVTARDLRRAR